MIGVSEFQASSPNCAVKVFVTRHIQCDTAAIAACTPIANSVGPIQCTSATTSRGLVDFGFVCNAGFTRTAGANNDTCGTSYDEVNVYWLRLSCHDEEVSCRAPLIYRSRITMHWIAFVRNISGYAAEIPPRCNVVNGNANVNISACQNFTGTCNQTCAGGLTPTGDAQVTCVATKGQPPINTTGTFRCGMSRLHGQQ
jgi:hypothetical protein